MEASARLMNVGATSPSWPAASRAAASQSDNTVPTSWAKHSDHDWLVKDLPSAKVNGAFTWKGFLPTNVNQDRLA